MRAVLRVMVVVGLLCSVRVAEAGRVSVVITRGDDIEYVRGLSGDEMLRLGVPFAQLGYHYHSLGVFFVDVWRWDGEFVAYSGAAYFRLTPEQVAAIGSPGVPWRYHLPTGLLIIAALIELAIVTARKRKVRTAFVLGGVMFLIAGVFRLEGMTLEWGIPALLGVHHVLGAWFALQHLRRLEESEAQEEPAQAPQPEDDYRLPPAGPPRSPPPVLDADPFRSPPRAPIVVLQPERPSSTPLAADASAEPPKLLR